MNLQWCGGFRLMAGYDRSARRWPRAHSAEPRQGARPWWWWLARAVGAKGGHRGDRPSASFTVRASSNGATICAARALAGDAQPRGAARCQRTRLSESGSQSDSVDTTAWAL